MATNDLTFVPPTQEEISARAYEIYVRGGSIPGRDLDHWLQAEAELVRERQEKLKKSSSRKPAQPRAAAAPRVRKTVIPHAA
jgi:hypothetical protein